MPSTTTSSGMTLQQIVARGERPFPSHPQVARYFPASGIEDARKRLARAIDRGDGPGLVIGAPGTGKSLLLQVLAAQYHERFDIVLLACTRLCTRRALLQAILFELGLPYRTRDEGQLRLSLLDQLLSSEQCPAGLLLLIDEAQSLSMPLLDELRVLTNVVRGSAPHVRLVLAGSSALEESFANPELESFSQRLAARTYLAPFNRQETIQFVRAQIAASGGGPDELVTAEGLNGVFDATDGVPRLVNQVCDRALLIAESENRLQIDRDVIQTAWSDLQQLPAPWTAPPASTASQSSAVVEFVSTTATAPAVVVANDLDLLECDDTEIDFEDDGITADLPQPAPVKKPVEKPNSRPAGTDPFAEEFDEEEIVLDTFAAWDEVFSSRTPRVENARDLGFASRVQHAFETVEAAQPTAQPDSAVKQFPDELVIEDDQLPEDEEFGDPVADAPGTNWPPIRLAAVEEFVPLKPIPLITPAGGVALTGAAAFDPVLPEEVEFDRVCFESPASPVPRARDFDRAPLISSFNDEDPILVIEDDHAEPPCRPPVRRENYRHLFSRLRSG